MTDETTPQDDAAMSLATSDLFHAEIARLHGVNDQLRAEIERLRSRPCPYVTGTVTHYCTLTPFKLTDAERLAICYVAGSFDHLPWYQQKLRGLLERTK